MTNVIKPSAISAIGIANPKYKRRQDDVSQFMISRMNLNPVEKRLARSIYKATGIEYRHSVLSDYTKLTGDLDFFPTDPAAPFPSTAERMKIYKANALDLALSAIDDCLAKHVNLLPKITHIITVSCTGMYAPGIDIEIIKALNLSTTIKRTAINFMGCYGAFNALKIADTICKSEPEAVVLIVCIEICTIHFQKSMSIDNIVASSIFSDGAAAMLVQSLSNQKIALSLQTFYCDLLPDPQKAMAWEISDHGFDIILSSYVPKLIKSGITNFTDNLLNRDNLKLDDISFYAIHPGGVKILEACEESLNITKDDNRYAYQILRQYGNMSSATIPFVLNAIWNDLGKPHHDKYIFSCAFGPGLTLESMILQSHCV